MNANAHTGVSLRALQRRHQRRERAAFVAWNLLLPLLWGLLAGAAVTGVTIDCAPEGATCGRHR